jgi:hypothetical protein
MYVGHVGVALGVRGWGWRRALPLSVLIVAAQGPDWIDTACALAHINSERAAMWSHSIPSALFMAMLFGAATWIRLRSVAAASTVAATYLSHLPADYITGLKPIAPGIPMIGLELYDRPRLDFGVELIVIVLGWTIWRTSLPRENRNRPAAWLLLAGLIGIQALGDIAFFLRQFNARLL